MMLALFLLACATVYLGTIEAAFSTLMRLSLRFLAERDSRGESMDRYLDDPIQLFVPVRLLLAIAVVSAMVLMARLIGAAAPHAVLALVLATLAFIVICEHLLPMLIVRKWNPERVLEVLLPTFSVLERIARPVTAPLVRLLTGLHRDRAGQPAAEEHESQTDGAPAAPEETAPPAIEREERRLLRSIVEFGDTLVREVMTPRPDIVAISVEATVEELRALFSEQEYSRIPVYKQALDNILGFVFVKDLILLPAQTPGGPPPTIASLIRPAHVVPETKRVAELLKEFQSQQIQIAIVVDEYGGTAGLVTLEDLLEEIVGEIRDEYDVETEPITEQPDGSLSVSGKVDIDKVAERLDVEIEREGFETVGGFLLSRLGRVPAVGERLDIDGLSVEILEAERRRVTRVRISRRPAEEAQEA